MPNARILMILSTVALWSQPALADPVIVLNPSFEMPGNFPTNFGGAITD